MEEVTGGSRKLHNELLHNFSLPSNIIKKIKSMWLRRNGHVVCMKGTREAFKVLVGKPEGKKPLGRPMYRWEDNIKTDLKEIKH